MSLLPVQKCVVGLLQVVSSGPGLSLQSWKEKSRDTASGLGSSQATCGWGLGECTGIAVPASLSCSILFLKHCNRWENEIDEPVLCLLRASWILIDIIFEYLSSIQTFLIKDLYSSKCFICLF